MTVCDSTICAYDPREIGVLQHVRPCCWNNWGHMTMFSPGTKKLALGPRGALKLGDLGLTLRSWTQSAHLNSALPSKLDILVVCIFIYIYIYVQMYKQLHVFAFEGAHFVTGCQKTCYHIRLFQKLWNPLQKVDFLWV